MATVLDFEKPIIDIQNKIEELRQLSENSGLDLEDQIELFEKQAEDKKKALTLLRENGFMIREKR